MIESYQIEVIRKRRAARFFWLVVFICALFLYFFFQGYYPDVRVGMRRIFYETGSTGALIPSDLIRSFGIINVRAVPTDSSISLDTLYYGNNEKRMSDYGTYTMHIEKEGYLTNYLEFVIDREKPFFIEKVTLLPRPSYQKFDGILEIYPMKNGVSLKRTATGYLSLEAYSTGRTAYTGSLRYIGSKYFVSATGALTWENGKFTSASQAVNNFIQTCKNVEWKEDLFYCPRSKSLLTEGGNYMTGILDIRDHLVERSGSIIQVEAGTLGKSWAQSGEINLENLAIINSSLYTNSSGRLIPRDRTQETITTPLDTIHHVSLLNEDMVFIGKKGTETHLIIRHSGDPVDRVRDIKFPEHLSYADIEFHSLGGNLMIETPRGILLIYRGSHEIQWIVEGEILSYTDTGAIYKKDTELWGVDWSEKIAQ